MTQDEKIERGLAAKVLLEDTNVAGFFKDQERSCFERAVSAKDDADALKALMQVRVLRAIRNDLLLHAQTATQELKKKDVPNA